MPHCCNYISASFAAQRPLTQLFLEDINFIVPVERMWSLSQKQELGWGLRTALQRATYACIEECTTSREWLWQTEEFWAEWFTFMVCLKHVNEAEGLFLALLVAAQVTYGWRQTRGILYRHIPHFHPGQQQRKATVEHLRSFLLLKGCFFLLLGLLWASHLVRSYLWACMGILWHAVSVWGLLELSL